MVPSDSSPPKTKTISFRDLSAKTDSSLESARSAEHDGVLGVVLSLRRSVL